VTIHYKGMVFYNSVNVSSIVALLLRDGDVVLLLVISNMVFYLRKVIVVSEGKHVAQSVKDTYVMARLQENSIALLLSERCYDKLSL